MRLRLSTRLILVVVLTQAVILFLLVWNSVRLMSASNTNLLEQSICMETRLLANSLAEGLAANDGATLADVISLLKDKKNLAYVVVYNNRNQRMAGLGDDRESSEDSRYEDALSDNIYDVVSDIELAGQHLGQVRVGYSIDIVRQIVSQARNQNTAIGIIGLTMSALITILLGLFMTRNLRKLEQGTQALGRGELDYRITVDSNDEIGDLSRSFNRMAQHLDETKMALQTQQQALEREKRFLETLVNGIEAVVMEATGPELQLNYVSKEAEHLLGYSTEQWLEPGFLLQHIYEDDRKWMDRVLQNNARDGNSFNVDFRMRHKSGELIWVRAINNIERDDEGNITIRGLLLDIMEQKSVEDRMLYLAEHDSLTGLINRRRFQEELERSIAFTQRYQQQSALLFIDLDQFKYINDSYGHLYGDEYLVDVSRRLFKALRRTDILGRLGGDEFGVIIPNVTLDEAETVANALLSTLSKESIKYNENAIHISASIGIVFFPNQGVVATDLLAKADAAMYSAKNAGRSQYHFFSEDDDELWSMQAKIHWEERIRWALEEGHFVLYYQPVVDLQTNVITHYEVLLRMLGKDGELILPAAFLDTAERFGLIRDIDCWVLQTAIKELALKREAGQDVSLAINISGRHFGSSDILSVVKDAMQDFNADPTKLIFEVTETAAVGNLAEARDFIDSLQDLGCRFALDDFGIGFSSFHYLRNLPVDFVKIDGSFVRNLHVDEEDRVFVKAMVDLAHGLGITCIAEFVENPEIVEVLKKLGVELGQGYYLSRPGPNTFESNTLVLN